MALSKGTGLSDGDGLSRGTGLSVTAGLADVVGDDGAVTEGVWVWENLDVTVSENGDRWILEGGSGE